MSPSLESLKIIIDFNSGLSRFGLVFYSKIKEFVKTGFPSYPFMERTVVSRRDVKYRSQKGIQVPLLDAHESLNRHVRHRSLCQDSMQATASTGSTVYWGCRACPHSSKLTVPIGPHTETPSDRTVSRNICKKKGFLVRTRCRLPCKYTYARMTICIFF